MNTRSSKPEVARHQPSRLSVHDLIQCTCHVPTHRRSSVVRPSTGFAVIIATLFHSTAWAHSNDLESSKLRLAARSAPPELRHKTRICSTLPRFESTHILSRAASFSLERIPSDDSMRTALPSTWRAADRHSVMFDVDEDSEPWDFGAPAPRPRQTSLAAAAEEKFVLRRSSKAIGGSHPSRIPKLSRTIETN